MGLIGYPSANLLENAVDYLIGKWFNYLKDNRLDDIIGHPRDEPGGKPGGIPVGYPGACREDRRLDHQECQSCPSVSLVEVF
ncbi:MAG: hypothetical protein N2201_04815 [candidate division WOR-3 bacterium]|nr:hypothetical protein [candidate division WOR-3 bacterium]